MFEFKLQVMSGQTVGTLSRDQGRETIVLTGLELVTFLAELAHSPAKETFRRWFARRQQTRRTGT